MTIKKQIEHAWLHLRRSPYQSLAALMIMAVTFLVATVVVLSTLGFKEILQYFETRPQVTLFLSDKIKQEQIDRLTEKLRIDNRVKAVEFISKEEAYKIYKDQNKNDPLLLEMVTANILPASLEVSTTKINYLAEIAEQLKKEDGVDEVVYQESLVNSLKSWMETVRGVGVGLLFFLIIFSFLIVVVVVGMKVAVRQEEVEILRLLGAGSWFIQSPFLWEGVIYGTFGAIFGWGSAYLFLLYSMPFLVKFFAGFNFLPVPFWLMAIILGVELVVGWFVGILASLVSVKRYLK